MADPIVFDEKAVAESWNRNAKLRDELAAKAGKPDNLETGVGDALLGLGGSVLSNTGSLVKNLSLGDASRAMRTTADGSYMQGNVDSAVDLVTGGDIQKTREQGKGLLTDALGLGDVRFVGVDPAKNPVKEAAKTAIGKAADAGTAVADSIDQNIIKPVVEPVGKAIQSGGEGLKNLRSDDAKLADQSKFYTQDENGNYHFGDAWGDPAKFVTRAVDVLGTLAPTILAALVTKGAVAPMVTKSMIKRGMTAEAAAVIGKATADRVAQNVVLAGGVGMSVGQSKDQAREAVSGLSHEELMNSPTFRENVRLVNEDPNNQTLSATQRLELARERTADQAASYAGSDPTTYAGAVAGTVLGDSYLFKMITGKKEAAQVTGNLLARTAKGFFKGGVREGPGETIEEGLQKNIANRASNEVGGTNIDPWEGAGLAALEAGTLGVMTGGGAGAISADIHGSSKPAADPTVNTTATDTTPQTTIPSNVAGDVDINTAIKEVSEGRKVPGSFSIGKGPEGYRAAYINQGGELRVTQPFATAEEAQQVAIGATQPIRTGAPQTTSPDTATQTAPEPTRAPDDIADIPAYVRQGGMSEELQAATQRTREAPAQQTTAPDSEQGVMTPIEKTVTGDPNEPAYTRTGAPLSDVLADPTKSMGGNKPRTVSGELLPAQQGQTMPATVEGQDGVTVDGQSEEIIPEARRIGQSDTIFAGGTAGDGINSNYVPPVTADRVSADQSLGQETVIDPRSPVGQAIENAGNATDAIFNQLKTVRVTKKGKPFATQKEAQMASRKTETPIELPTGGFGVVDKAELEQVQASQAPVKQPSSNAGQLGQSAAPTAPVMNDGTKQPEASQVNHDSNEAPGSDVGNGFKTGPYKGEKYRVSTTNTTGAENGTPILEKRLPSGSAATFYVGKDGNLLDADNVIFNDESSKERVWRPASKEQTAEAASILDEMGKLELNNPKRAELKVKLKALVLGEATSTIKPSMQAEASQNQSITEISQEERNRAIENRASSYDRLANEQDELGDLGDKELAAKYRAKAEEVRQRKSTSQPNADQAAGMQSPETVTAPVVAKESQPTPAPTTTQSDGDVRGLSYAIVGKSGEIKTSGSIPSLGDPKHETSQLDYYRALADKMGGDLYFGETEAAPMKGNGPLIMGKTWQEIQAMQQGKPIPKSVTSKMPKNAVLVHSSTANNPAPVRTDLSQDAVDGELETPTAAGKAPEQSPERAPDKKQEDRPWTSAEINKYGTINLNGDPDTLKQWATANNVTFGTSKNGIVVAKSSVPYVQSLISQEADHGNATQRVTDDTGLPDRAGNGDRGARPQSGTGAVAAESDDGRGGRGTVTAAVNEPADGDTGSVGGGRNGNDHAVTVVEHTTGRGKVLRGVVRTDLTKDQAMAIDKYTFKKDGGYFIREKHLDKLPPVKASTELETPTAAGIDGEQRPVNKRKVANTLKPAQKISEAELKDRDLLKEHGGKWKYRYAVGANWQTANTKESAIERATEAHSKAIANGDLVPTRDERFDQANKDIIDRMDQRYGKMSVPELEKEHARLGGVVSALQKAGKNEFNGNGGRRTGAATSNEGARDAGLEKMRLEGYIQARKERESTAGNNENSQGIIENSLANYPETTAIKPEKTIEDHFKDLSKYQSGEMDFDEFKQAASDFLDNEESVKAKLAMLTKPEILKRMGPMFNYNHKGDKKDVIVDAAYQSLAGQLRFAAQGDKDVITETVSFEEIQGKRARKTTASKAREEIAALTSEKYGIYQEKAKAATKKAEERFQKVKQQITDPQTLDDFETFLNYRSIDKLTPEQKARYEDLKAERNLDKRDQAAAAAKETKVVPTATGDIVKTKHTKEGYDLFVVKLADRVDRDAYTTINAKAKELGGYYSKFRGNGAIPGFQFRTEEQAKEFQQWLSNTGNESPAVTDVKATTDITAEPEVTSEESSKKKQADKLRDRAASVREKAQAELNADRKSNTAKRAREASYAIARAEADLNFANMLDVIANGIEAGEIKYLRNMTAGTQLETLNRVLRRIIYGNKMNEAIRNDLIQKGYLHKNDNSELSWTENAPVEVITQYADMPGMDYSANILRDTAKNMQTTAGFKQAGVKIMNQALMAINAENRMVTISDPDLIDKLKQFSKQHEVRDYLKDTMADYDRLVRMGITSPIELRAALRELHKVKQSLKGTRPKRDPVKQKEDALKMRLLNNRNAFVDFFPTPEDHANDVIARAGIEPGMRVLEPSAGHGALAVAARDAGATVDAVELSGELRDILTEKGFNLVGSDFMATEPAGEYDAVVMNPPFSNDMDIDHVKHAYAHLKPGGRLVAIVSSMAGERSNNKNKQFKEWLDSLGATEEMMPEGSFKNSMNPTSVRTKIIELQKPADSENVKPQPMGSRVTIHTPKGKPVEVQYQLVSAADLVASNEFDGRVNKAYPQELQPRDRTKASYQQQVKQIASNPEGSRLAGSPESDRGAPIVRDLVVESGNGRTIGIKQAYKQGTATEYRDYLIKHADEFGFTADDVNLIDDPVLIRQRVSDLSPEERLDFVVDSNTDAKMANSATEDAKADARYLDNGLMDLLNIPEGGDLLAASNERFLSSFATKLGVNSLNIYKDSAGRWNEAFRKRVSNAIFAYGYDNDTLLKAATGDTSEAGKNLTNALMNNAAKVAELRSMVPESAKSFVNYLAEGIDVMTSAKRNGQSIQEVVNQGDMLSGGVSHYGGAMAEMLADASRSGKRLTEILNQITGMLNESAKAADQIDLLTGEPTQQVTAEEAINAAEKYFNERKQQEQRVRPSQDLFGANSARIGDNNGSGTSVSRPVSASETKSAGENSRLNLVNGLLGGETEKVQFSKMPLNAAEKSGKGMTKPEAELAAKEWLRQFKTDIGVKVVRNQAEFNQMLEDMGQSAVSADEVANAAYIPESKTLLLNASAIQNPARLRKLMRHEILGHHGLEYVIGKGAFNYILQILKNGYSTSAAIREAMDTVAANYAGADSDTQIKESFAHYAENRPVDKGAMGRLWDRVVSMVKAALVKVGFIKQNEAEQQLDALLKTIAEQMRNGTTNNDPNGGPGKKAYFSKAASADNELMSKVGLGVKPDAIDKAKAQLDKLKQADRITIKAWIDRVVKKANTEVLDALAPIKYAEELAGKAAANTSGYVAARLASGSSSVMQATMLYGLPEWKDGVIQRKANTGDKDALLGIFEELGPDLHNWLAWMAGHRAEILKAEGRENLLTDEDIKALKDKGNGKDAQFLAAKAKWNAMNKAVLDLGEEAGLFTAQDRKGWESEWYIPFFRETESGDVTGPYKHKGIANQSSGIKKLKGGTTNVNDLLENIFVTTSNMIDAAMKNMAAQKVVYNLADTDLINVITKPNLMDIEAALKNKRNMMIVRIEGERYVLQVNDQDLFNAMTLINQNETRDPFRKLAMAAKHLLTAGVTASPDFIMRNFLRDAASTWAINEDGFTPMMDSIRGVKKALQMNDSSIDMMFSGASFMGGNLRGTDPEAMASAVRKALRRKGMSPEQIDRYQNTLITTGIRAKEVLAQYWDKYERFGEAVENGSREAVYEAAIKAGKSHAQAAFEARDLMDFSMRGSSAVMRYLVDVLPFFNARMQGLGKLGRAIAANPGQVARRGGMIAGASLALLAANWDDDRYEELPDWDKDLNWHFWLGDEHFRIPKPFEIGLMFGTLPERMVRTMGGKDTAAKFGEVVARNMLETFAINPIPQVIKPITEAYFNYDMFRGAPIENMSDLNVMPEARYDERTSLLMRELADATGMSPKKLEHIVTGYTGTIGAYVIAMGDMLVRKVGDYGETPSWRADQIPVLKSVYQGSAPAKSTQSMQDFYKLMDETNQLYATIKQYKKEGRTEEAAELESENQDALRNRKQINKVQLQFRAIRNEMEMIQREKSLNAEEKRVRIDRLLSRRNDLASKLTQRFGGK